MLISVRVSIGPGRKFHQSSSAYIRIQTRTIGCDRKSPNTFPPLHLKHEGSQSPSPTSLTCPVLLSSQTPHPPTSPPPPSFTGSRSSGSNRSGNKAGALETKSGGSGSETEKREKALSERSAAPPSEHSIRSAHSALSQGQNSSYGPPVAAAPGSPSARDLASVPPELTASRQSFRMAMGNPSEFFVDVM